MRCVNAIPKESLDTGPVHAVFSGVTSSGCARLNAPFIRRPPETESAASPAVEVTFAVVAAEYVRPTPGVKTPNDAGPPSESDSVAGTVPPTLDSIGVLTAQ